MTGVGMTFHIYLARDGWRWRLKARNGRIVAESGEAYKRKNSAWRMVQRILQLDSDGYIVLWD